MAAKLWFFARSRDGKVSPWGLRRMDRFFRGDTKLDAEFYVDGVFRYVQVAVAVDEGEFVVVGSIQCFQVHTHSDGSIDRERLYEQTRAIVTSLFHYDVPAREGPDVASEGSILPPEASSITMQWTPTLGDEEKLREAINRKAGRDIVGSLLGAAKSSAPLVELADSSSSDQMQLMEAVAARRNLRRSGQALPPPGASDMPRRIVTTSKNWVRLPSVIEHVLARAAGFCEACGTAAPFMGLDDEPFLEVHHVHRLADGGPDRVENAVAVCPNCHRALHLAKDRVQRQALLYERVPVLRRFLP